MQQINLRIINISTLLKIVTLLFLFSLTGCFATKAGAYKVFADDLTRLEGKPFKEAYVFFVGKLADEKPIKTKYLKNNNEIRIYKMKKERNQDCTVYIEIDPKTDLVVVASSSGNGCWRPY